MTRDDWLDKLLGAVDELTRSRRTVELVESWDASRNKKRTPRYTDHEPLLVELAQAVVPAGSSQDGSGGRPVPGSRPPANLDAIDRLTAIRAAVVLWCSRVDVRARGAVSDDLRALVGVTGRLDDDMVRWLALDAVQWVAWAKVVTGWVTPPFAPHVSCPACERTGGLRIRYEQKIGACLTCGADWREDDGGIYVLADHIRMTSEGQSA